MFGSPRSKPRPQAPQDISPLLATDIALEYSSLRAPNNCPTGIYLTPAEETLLKWHGVFFIHRGPFAGSVLRFTVVFPRNYPLDGPIVRFSSDVFHPMVHPKTKIWYPRGQLAQWRPRIHHISHLLHNLKSSFNTKALESVTEDEAVNKHVWSLYHHNYQTFISITSQRAMHTASQYSLYPDDHPLPPSPTRSTSGGASVGGSPQKRQRQTSMQSLVSDDGMGPSRDMIKFGELSESERERLWVSLKESLVES